MLSPCLVIQRGMYVTPLGVCLRVIVNEKPLNLEKTTSSVLSVLSLIFVPESSEIYFSYSSSALSSSGGVPASGVNPAVIIGAREH